MVTAAQKGQISGQSEAGKPASAIQMAGLGAAGAWLILLIAGSVFVAVLIFSATQFQLRFSNFVVDGGSLSIWKAEQLRAQWRTSRETSRPAIEQAKNTLNESRQALTKALSGRRQAQLAGPPARQELLRARGVLLAKIQKIDQQFAKTLESISSFTRNPEGVSTDEFGEALKTKLVELELKDATIGPDHRKYSEARTDWEQKVADFERKGTDLNDLRELIERNQNDLAIATKSARLSIATNEDKPLQEDQRAQIENAIYEFDAMYDSWFGRLVYRLTLIPSDVLVLTLVIIMGLLGSSLQLSYIYATQYEAKNTSFYIIRPLFGVITAFVIFIVAKAGIPLIADSTRLGANAPINPYFISFLAIISGMLSERALVSLTRIGSNYFREGDAAEPLRWARKSLVDDFRTAGRDPDQLRRMLKAKDSEWNEWLQGKDAMPASVQVMIAAVLQKPRRELFTDIPPDVSDPEPEIEDPPVAQPVKNDPPAEPMKDGPATDPSQATGTTSGEAPVREQKKPPE